MSTAKQKKATLTKVAVPSLGTASAISDTSITAQPKATLYDRYGYPIDNDNDRNDVTNEVNINVRNPVPLELENTWAFSPGGSKYIPFLTQQDDQYFGWDTFFNTLLELRLQSSTLDAVLDSKTDFTVGDGVYIKGVDIQKNPDREWSSFVRICNTEPEGLNAVVRSVITNFLTFGNAPIEIVRGTSGGKRWLHVYSKNQLDCRKAWPDGNNESTSMIISRWFRKRGYMNLTQKFNIRIPFYKIGPGNKDAMWVEDTTNNFGQPIKGVQRTALWLRNKYPGYDHYGLPSWIASMINAELEYSGSVYNHDNLKNGMNIGGLLTVDGNLSATEQKRMAKMLRDTFAGKGRGGRTMVVASTDNINKSDWKPFNTHKDGSYIDLDTNSINKIITANKWDGAFLGNKDGMSKAKSGAYLNELYQQKIKTVITPLHRIIIDGFFIPLCEIADEWLGTHWSEYDIAIQVQNLFNDTTEASTTVNGVVALTNILKLVGSGVLPHANAVNLIAMKWGMQVHDAEGIVNGIKVITPGDGATTKNINENE